jgi:hypothetical protein
MRRGKSVAEYTGERIKKFTEKPMKVEKRTVERRSLDKNQFERRTDDGNRRTLNRGARRVEGYEDDDYEEYEEGVQMSYSAWIIGTFFLALIIFILSPGVVLTIPPTKGGIFMSGNTSKVSAFVHAVIIALLLNYI